MNYEEIDLATLGYSELMTFLENNILDFLQGQISFEDLMNTTPKAWITISEPIKYIKAVQSGKNVRINFEKIFGSKNPKVWIHEEIDTNYEGHYYDPTKHNIIRVLRPNETQWCNANPNEKIIYRKIINNLADYVERQYDFYGMFNRYGEFVFVDNLEYRQILNSDIQVSKKKFPLKIQGLTCGELPVSKMRDWLFTFNISIEQIAVWSNGEMCAVLKALMFDFDRVKYFWTTSL